MAITGGAVETLDEIPAHVWKGLPDGLSLGPSAVNQSRVGVWATQSIPKGKRFGPFVGEKKKRSQVTSNVYMWEVYFPARGWMCVDATDPMKGNWLRYVNWARSSDEQNLFPLEINRAIYYKVLRPIGPGEELLVWYTVEDNPEITAALEEERASSLNRKNSPRAKRARRKLLDRARQSGLGGFKKASETKPTVKEMWDGEESLKEEDERPSTLGPSQELQETHSMGSTDQRKVADKSAVLTDRGNGEEGEEEEEEEEEDADDMEESGEMQKQSAQPSSAADSMPNKHPGPSLTCEENHNNVQGKFESSSPAGQEPEVDPDLDLDPDPDEGDPHGESYPCQHCERHFSTRQGLERHNHIHAITNQQTQLFKCRYCSKSFGSQVGRRRHERRHESGPKKRPGSLAGTATLLSPVVQTDGSSPDCTGPTTQYLTIGSQFTGGALHNSELQRRELADRPFMLDENGESKELHPCKYCNKAFGTHTNMRRHQRRIHERHLLPKGVRRKGMLLQEAAAQQQLPSESPSTSPPPVYVPSADTEDETDRDDYTVDISKNISENLSFYIDGKIVSTSSVSTCEVIEVDSRSAALFGLDTVIISPNQISQALKVEGRSSVTKQVSSIGQPAAKRRTSTPPLIPSLKVETDAASFTASSSSSSTSTSSSSNLLVRGLFQQAADSSAFQREKTVYLSPKLKQLLQTQDIKKSAISVVTESHRLASPLSVTPLPGASGRFKRRTSSPPSSPQLSPACKMESFKAEVASSYNLKVPKLESHSVPPTGGLQEREDGDGLNLSGNSMQDQSSNSGGNSCNQQPLDLSYSVNRRSDNLNKTLGDSALDLSFHRKSNTELDSKTSPAPQPLTKKRKPNTSMLEKVLMNEYVGLPLQSEESPVALASVSCFPSQSPNVSSESAHPSPPSLTPVTMNPSSPSNSSVTSPTPPPPVLPTIPSPPDMPSSPLSRPLDASIPRPLPVLSPKMSPRSVEHKSPSDSEEVVSAEENQDEEDSHISELLDSPKTLMNDSLQCSAASNPPESTPVDLPASEEDSATAAASSLPNGKMNQNLNSITDTSLTAVSPRPESASSPSAPHESPQSLVSQSLPQMKIKEEPHQCVDELSVMNHAPQDSDESSPLPAAPGKLSDKNSEAEEVDSMYCKTFVCNVCEQPFNSIKELSGHIAEHAADWPFKCEFCVQLFGDAPALLTHRTTLHGVGRIFVCSVCSKEFAFLCNLQQHQKDLHPNETCSHTAVESGKLRPQNYTDPSRAKEESRPSSPAPDTTDEAAPDEDSEVAKEESDVNGFHAEDPNEELYTTIKIMASEGSKPKGPDVRLGINQHYPSYKPPPFPYHSRSHAGSVASATNFTTHNIPQTFSTAIRCTKCGNSFDNMPELHQHILACANASDKKRYTPKKNPIPLKQIVKSPNGVVSPSAAAGQSAFRRMGQPKRLNFNQDAGKMKMSALSKKKNQLVQKAISHKNKTATFAKKASVKVEDETPSNVCPHCSREFTYPASLSKHMAISCPMKPVVKKGKKGLVEVKKETTVDKNMNLRKKASDGDIAQTEAELKPLGKTRARSSGAADPETPHPGKGKNTATMGRMKRPVSFPAPVPASKKSKKGHVQSLPPTPSTPDTPSDTAQQRPAMRMQRMGKEAGPKRLAEAKSPPQQLKKEERFSLRARDRVGGPVTRSLQMANAAPSAEVKAEEPPSQEPKETQEVLMK
ncbi:uncharacterized protein V6R79_015559 [Siganus canaliculatus]